MKPEKQLYQWDVNQYLTGINPAAQYVDYPIGDDVIRLETDSTRCRIPDEVLQTYGGKTCYERYPDGTYRAYSFTVLYAPKPPDYVFTPEERTTFEALTARVDAAIDEIKRRADSGEFTPVKGVDYFTNAEKAEMMESVSDGAIGEFREIVDSATSDFNENSSVKTNDYNTNAEKKLSTYNSNATEKFKVYNDNHTEKITAYDTNATDKLSTYNSNAEQKLESYNQNHTEKVAEYNQNAETKTAEFDSNAAALQTEVDRLRGECDTLAAEKANVDGYYEEMTVGDAEQLIATQFVEDNEPYLFRPTGGSYDVGNRAYLDKIVGGTVAWNQLYGNSVPTGSTIGGVTFTPQSDGTIVVNGTQDGINDIYYRITGEFSFGDHVVLLRGCPSGGSISTYSIYLNNNSQIVDIGNGGVAKQVSQGNAFYIRILKETTTTFNNVKFKPQVFDLTQMFGSTIADYIYSIEQSQAGAGVAWFKKLFPKDYYPYNAGELLSVEGLQSHDTVGFNQWDEDWEVGTIGLNGQNANDNTRIRCKNYIHCIDSATYYVATPADVQLMYYDENKNFIGYQEYSNKNTTFKPMSGSHYMRFYLYGQSGADYGTTYNHDICINLSDPSRNGEYEPYEKHSYPLDNSLTLRGIPKLDARNNLYYDGDEYTSNGKVKRKYGVVEIGSLPLVYNGSILGGKQFGAYVSGKKFGETNIFSNAFITSAITGVMGMMSGRNSSTFVAFNSSITTLADFKSAMQGVYLVYELATPTTETAEPFQHIQIVDDFGTEEFVSTGIVPVGHKTRYPANLRDKLQHLPDLASADGTYLIQQSGKQMSLVHTPAVFPETPTEDGTYTLKTVVTGGVATLQWVVE